MQNIFIIKIYVLTNYYVGYQDYNIGSVYLFLSFKVLIFLKECNKNNVRLILINYNYYIIKNVNFKY